LKPAGREPKAGHVLQGVVRHVRTGTEARFGTADELIGFLAAARGGRPAPAGLAASTLDPIADAAPSSAPDR
jgi:hypothetical protein